MFGKPRANVLQACEESSSRSCCVYTAALSGDDEGREFSSLLFEVINLLLPGIDPCLETIFQVRTAFGCPRRYASLVRWIAEHPRPIELTRDCKGQKNKNRGKRGQCQVPREKAQNCQHGKDGEGQRNDPTNGQLKSNCGDSHDESKT